MDITPNSPPPPPAKCAPAPQTKAADSSLAQRTSQVFFTKMEEDYYERNCASPKKIQPSKVLGKRRGAAAFKDEAEETKNQSQKKSRSGPGPHDRPLPPEPSSTPSPTEEFAFLRNPAPNAVFAPITLPTPRDETSAARPSRSTPSPVISRPLSSAFTPTIGSPTGQWLRPPSRSTSSPVTPRPPSSAFNSPIGSPTGQWTRPSSSASHSLASPRFSFAPIEETGESDSPTMDVDSPKNHALHNA